MPGFRLAHVSHALAAASIAVLALPAGALSAEVDDFYKSHDVTISVGFTAGSAYDLYARLLARSMPEHLPGKPTMIVQAMPGAGSLKLVNYLYSVAPKDGTAFGIFARGVPTEPLIGANPVQYDASKLTWIGSVSSVASICATWHETPIKTFNDLLTKPSVFGGEGAGSNTATYPVIIKSLFNAPIKLIVGYPGGNEINLAMEQREVDGRCSWSWSAVKGTKPDWIRDKKINILAQLSLKKNEELPDVPSVMDFAKTERQRQIMTLVFSGQDMGWPFAAPPDLPTDRKQALRAAFSATVKDPAFLARAAEAKLEVVDPMSGADVEKLVATMYATDPAVLAEAKEIMIQGAR
jgi:tripartite-type tricarboxylate transporter receptor subunit TctC